MANVQHECPKCKTIMNEINPERIQAKKNKVNATDFGTGIHGTSGTSTTTSFNYSETTATVIPPYINATSSVLTTPKVEIKPVVGVPYECPSCGYKTSFRS